MAAPRDIGLGPPPMFDKRGFRERMKKLGTAYRNQALELISICRVFSLERAADQIFSQDTELSE